MLLCVCYMIGCTVSLTWLKALVVNHLAAQNALYVDCATIIDRMTCVHLNALQ